MIPLYSPAQIRELDTYAVSDLQIPSIVLMENAALNIRELLLPLLDEHQCESICILCGKGNNGGDGYALARHLSNEGFHVTVISLYQQNELSSDALINYRILVNANSSGTVNLIQHSPQKKLQLSKYDVIIEAMLGSGFTGVPDGYLSGIINQIAKSKSLVVAVDVPAGLNSATGYGETICKADITITLGGLKKGLFFNLGKIHAGEVYGAGIGISDNFLEEKGTDTFLLTPEYVASLLPEKNMAAHKYTSGKVLHIAGSKKYPGAGILSSLASFKVGAGASILAVGKSYADRIIALAEPYQVFEEFDDAGIGYFTEEAMQDLKPKIEWSDAVVIGPGIGTGEDSTAAVYRLTKSYSGKPLLIDADALKIFSIYSITDITVKNAILTPHMGEFSKMTGTSVDELRRNMLEAGSAFCQKHQCFLVLKDFVTVIFTPDGRKIINNSGNAGLAKFGTGDVLSGMIGGFLAQTKDPLQSAILGVYLHGLAADILQSRMTEYGFTAKDVLSAIPEAVKLITGCNA